MQSEDAHPATNSRNTCQTNARKSRFFPLELSPRMQVPLEDLEYQRRAIATVVGVLDGQVRNTFDNSNLFGIQANVTDLTPTPTQVEENKKHVIPMKIDLTE